MSESHTRRQATYYNMDCFQDVLGQIDNFMIGALTTHVHQQSTTNANR